MRAGPGRPESGRSALRRGALALSLPSRSCSSLGGATASPREPDRRARRRLGLAPEAEPRGGDLVVKGWMAAPAADRLPPLPQSHDSPSARSTAPARSRSTWGPRATWSKCWIGLPVPLTVHLGAGSDKFIGNGEPDTCYSEGSTAQPLHRRRRQRRLHHRQPEQRLRRRRRQRLLPDRRRQRRLLGRARATTSAGWAPGRTAATAKAATTDSTAGPAPTSSTAAMAATTATACRAAVAPKDARAARGAERNGTEGVGFEPTSALRRQQFSRLPRSTTPAPLRGFSKRNPSFPILGGTAGGTKPDRKSEGAGLSGAGKRRCRGSFARAPAHDQWEHGVARGALPGQRTSRPSPPPRWDWHLPARPSPEKATQSNE